MKCPVCSHEFADDLMYCPKCGYEVQIVPEFETEIENSIKENMSGVVANMDDTPPGGQADYVIRKKVTSPKNRHSSSEYDYDEVDNDISNSLPVTILLCVLATAIVVIAIVVIVNLLKEEPQSMVQGSYSFYYEEAISNANAGNYTDAIESMYKALRKESNHPEARMLIADYEVKANMLSDAENLYKDLFGYEEYAQEAYEKYIALLEMQGRESDICNTLAECDVPSILKKYPQYVSEPPTFSLAEGSYEDAQQLQMMTSQEGTIYYTMNGDDPDETSTVYEQPIDLDYGAYTVKAIFVNQYGRRSDVVTRKYVLNVDFTFEPQVTPVGGSYTEPQYIHVDVKSGCRVYYTTDGTIPTQLSIPYTHDIMLPFGKTSYWFISYDEYGKTSEVVKMEYHFDSVAGAKVGNIDAILITAQGLFDRGILSNTDGTKAGDPGIYSYETSAAFVYNDRYYYLMTEYYTDALANKNPTSVQYAVGIGDGILYKCTLGTDGHYVPAKF